MKRKAKARALTQVRCALCGEGVRPGIRPVEGQHATPVECFTAMKRAVRETRDVLAELVASIKGGQTRVIKATFSVDRDERGKLLWTIIVTDPLGNEDRMARLIANTWAAVYEGVAARVGEHERTVSAPAAAGPAGTAP